MAFTRTVVSAALAAAATYFFDPVSGRRRRARSRDKLMSTLNEVQSAAGTAARDLAHRSQGMIARTRSALHRGDDWADDDILVERVRSAIGRVVSHPGAIDVRVHEGRALVSGAILEHEREALLKTVRAVPGVHEVQDYLSAYQSADGVPSLQGGSSMERQSRSRRHWPPGMQLLFGVLGGALITHGLRRRGVLGFLTLSGGTALVTRSLMNRPLSEIAGRPRHGKIIVGKALRVNAPVERVFETLANYTNFPKFMRSVREVRQDPDGRSHWVVAGPGGVAVEWDSITTRYEPNRVISWCSLPGSTVDHAGTIRLEPSDDGGTFLEVRMSYSPPAGTVGHIVAQLFGRDPKTEMDEDLLRLKSYLETGAPPRDAAAAKEAARTERQSGVQSEQQRQQEQRPH